MAKIIRAICTTASADDKMGRVRLKSEGVWGQETEPVMSLNGCALNKGDVVFVSVEDGCYNPLILGKADRNDIVLNLLVERINSLEDKTNEVLKQQNEILNQLKTNMGLVAVTPEGAYVWGGASPTAFGAMTPVNAIPTKTTLKDIQDNYK